MIPTAEYAYELSLRAALPRLGVEVADLDSFSCCGSPIASVDRSAANYLALRNIALGERSGSGTLLVPCNGCYLNLVDAYHHWRSDEEPRADVDQSLKKEGLSLKGTCELMHVIDFLHDRIGLEAIRRAVTRPLPGLRLLSHTGCHLLRPSSLLSVDDPEDPKKLDALIRTLGAETLTYPENLDCCGAGLLLSHPETAMALSAAKLKAIQALGIDGLVVSCPSCHTMYDAKQEAAGKTIGQVLSVPVLYYTQLLGLAIGLDQRVLGLQLNKSPIDRLIENISLHRA